MVLAKKFMDADFLLDSEPAKKLFAAAKDMPIFDWHCHLSPKEIYENRQPEDIAYLWLAGDHYKWRAMRSCGVDEKYITGNATGYEKFRALAEVMPCLIGNPLYHWTHLELQRYFDIYEPLSAKTCDSIWERANAKIKSGGFTPRELIKNSGVTCLCTTDDPADTLEYHVKLAADETFGVKVIPAFRPDKALGIELPGWRDWLAAMEKTAGVRIESWTALTEVLTDRIDYFASLGCRASDHAFGEFPYLRASAAEVELIFSKAAKGEELTDTEIEKFKTELLRFLAKEYAKRGWGMELHIGPMRNNNTAMFNKLGPDAGFDSIDDREVARKLSRFMDSVAQENLLPRTVLFTLNPKDNYVLGSMLGNFQTEEAQSKIQFGSAWWFNDNKSGICDHLRSISEQGVLGTFIGMLTDSRCFLSYTRHEYFRRILCI